MADEHSFHAEVLTPEGKVFEGDVDQLSTRTSVGEIGIQARHVPVLARLQPTELRLISGSDTTRFAQAEGWLQVFANRAIVLVGECVPPSELDTAQLNDRLKDAEQRRDEAEEGSAARERAERDVLRTETFLELAGSSSSN